MGRLTADFVKDDMGFGLAISCSECHSKKTNRHYPDFVSEHNQDFGGDSIGGRTIPYFDGGRVAGDAMLGSMPTRVREPVKTCNGLPYMS